MRNSRKKNNRTEGRMNNNTGGKAFLKYFNLGCSYYKNRKYKKAILNFDKSRRLNKNFYQTTLLMGLSFYNLGNNNSAEACLTEVLALNPENITALSALAFLYCDEKEYERSLQIIEGIINRDSGNKKIRRLRADLLYCLDRIDEYAEEQGRITGAPDGFREYAALLKKFQYCYASSEESPGKQTSVIDDMMNWDDFIKSIPVETFNDKYGTLDDKIKAVKKKIIRKEETAHLITLSLCHLLKGDTTGAIEYLLKVKKAS